MRRPEHLGLLGDRWTASDFQAAVGATDAQVEDLQSFRDLLADWRMRMNLVGPSAMAEFWLRHAFDSAQLLHVEQSALRWADIGAGAGFPGIVLAILMKARFGTEVHLVESSAKRTLFLNRVVSDLKLPASVHHVRAEDLSPPAGLQVITARACAPFPRLFGYTAELFRSGANGLFLKGRDAHADLDAARQQWSFVSDMMASRSNSEGWIVRVSKLAPRV